MYFFLIALLSSFQTVLAALCALAVHEIGHIVIARAVKEPVSGIELTPFGGVLHYAQGRSGYKGLRGAAVAAAGPAANYLLLILLGSSRIQNALGNALTEQMIVANASMMLLNLLPALPLDGGRIVLSVGFYLFRITVLIRVLCMLGCAVGALLLVFSVAGFRMYGLLNCSLVVIGIYLIGCAWISKEALIYENTYTVIKERQEKNHGIQKARIWMVDADTRLHELIPVICGSEASVFILKTDQRELLIQESVVLSGMLADPTMTIKDAAQKHRNVDSTEN